MLPKTNRLLKTKDFQATFKRGKAFRGGGLLLRVDCSAEGESQFGVVVSKKVAKAAVRRNRIRRVLTEAIREELGSIREGCGVSIIVLPGFEMGQKGEARATLHRLLQEASLVS